MFEDLFQIAGVADWAKYAIIICIAFVVLGYVCLIGVLGNLWLQALLSGAPVKIAELVAMTLRKVDRKTIVCSRITAAKAGIDLSTAQLEAHYLAGGCVPDIVRAMIILDQAGVNPGWDVIAKEDLLGRDVLGEAELTAEKIITSRSMLEIDQGHVEVDETLEAEYE